MTNKTQADKERLKLYTEYNDFIRQTDILDIRVYRVALNNLGCETLPTANLISYTIKSWYENREDESVFHAFQRYNVSIKDTGQKKKVANLSVTFWVIYSTRIFMTEELFNIFEHRNLQLNTWPYFREFTHNMFERMGLVKVIAPAYRILPILKK